MLDPVILKGKQDAGRFGRDSPASDNSLQMISRGGVQE
jgi:hypothetical protein